MHLPNLFWRGMILALIPLLLQLSIVCTLAYFFHKLKLESARESRSQELIAQIFMISRDSMGVIYCMSLRFDPSESFETKNIEAQIAPNLRQIRTHLDRVIAENDTDSLLLERLKSLKKIQTKIDYLHEMSIRQTFNNEFDRMQFALRFFLHLRRTAREHAQSTNSIVLLEQERQAQIPTRIRSLISTVWMILTIALIVSVLLAVILSYTYVILIKRPMKKICSTGRLLAQREMLPEPSGGNDELSSLERLLYYVSGAVREATAKESDLIKNAANMICSISQKGEFLAANPYTKIMLGLTTDQIVGSHLHDIVIEEDFDSCSEKLRKARESDTMSNFELRIRTAQNNIIDTMWACFWSESQKILFCVVHDVTERKNAERIKQDLTDMISHDLRSPLTSVNISLALLARGAKGTLEETQRQKIEGASAEVLNLIELINDLLDFQKLSAGKIEINKKEFDLMEEIERVADTFALKAEEKQVVIDIAGEKAPAIGDTMLLRQAMTVLISSAVKVSPRNTIVKIEIIRESSSYQVTVKDWGAPLAASEIESLLYSTFTSKIESDTGRSLLKLSICKLIAQAHFGEMGMITDDRSDSCIFWIRIPDAESMIENEPNFVFKEIAG
ncbi:MAG: PAS domain-containing sensor histidine kinase [Leptolyngbya sp.]|nr:PAS domain-containing sensor histidine kinase [Candidatus Melainabacteria bacterium]